MTRRTLLTRFLASCVLLLVSLVAAPVLGQTLAQAPLSPTRENQSKTEIGEAAINRQDCLSDDVFTFTLNAAGLAGGTYDVQVWAAVGSANCTVGDQQSGTSGQCKEVRTAVNAFETMTFDVRVQDIVSATRGPWSGPAMNEGCEGDSDPQTRVLQFFLVTGGAPVEGSRLDYSVTFDLLGPGPPTRVKAGVGERVLVVSWKEPSDATGVSEYRVYTDAVSGADGGAPDAGDAGTTDAGEMDGGEAGAASGGGSTDCTSDDLVPGEPPPAGRGTNGTTNASTTQVEAKGLTNGVRYAVAVASVDSYGNSGVLSALVCGTPEPVTGFFEAYRAAGGGAGGGYCAIGAAPSRVAAAGIVFAALGLFFRRWRRTAKTNGRGAA